MLRPSPQEMPPWYHPYLKKVPEKELPSRLLAQSWKDGIPFWRGQEFPRKPYAPGKWNLHTLLQHLIDTERVFQYRALQAAREDGASLADYDHEAYARATEALETDYSLLLQEWAVVRQAGTLLFHGFSDETLQHQGHLKKGPVTVRAMAYIMVGHVRHHLQVVQYHLG